MWQTVGSYYEYIVERLKLVERSNRSYPLLGLGFQGLEKKVLEEEEDLHNR
jgi:hypothetical protein